MGLVIMDAKLKKSVDNFFEELKNIIRSIRFLP